MWDFEETPKLGPPTPMSQNPLISVEPWNQNSWKTPQGILTSSGVETPWLLWMPGAQEDDILPVVAGVLRYYCLISTEPHSWWLSREVSDTSWLTPEWLFLLHLLVTPTALVSLETTHTSLLGSPIWSLLRICCPGCMASPHPPGLSPSPTPSQLLWEVWKTSGGWSSNRGT
jgi:hypothetical protein